MGVKRLKISLKEREKNQLYPSIECIIFEPKTHTLTQKKKSTIIGINLVFIHNFFPDFVCAAQYLNRYR